MKESFLFQITVMMNKKYILFTFCSLAYEYLRMYLVNNVDFVLSTRVGQEHVN